MRKLLFLFALCFAILCGVPLALRAQTAATLPYNCDFESATEVAGWTLVNGTCYNHLCIDTLVNTTAGGNHALYITQFTPPSQRSYGYKTGSGTAGDITYVTSRVFAYRDITFAAAGTYNVGYWWKSQGESIYDYGRVALAPASWTFAASTSDWDSSTTVAGQYFGSHSLPSTWIGLDRGYNLSGSSTAQYYSNTFTVPAAGTYRLVVMWTNDGNTGENPPLMIDDIEIKDDQCATPTHFFVERSTTDSVTFRWTENGTATSWIVEYDTVGELTGYAHVDTVAATRYTIASLAAGGCYNVKVRAFCGTSASLPLFHQITMPSCSPVISLPYNFNFDSASVYGAAGTPPSMRCWTHINAAASASYCGYPYLNSGGSHTGAMSLYWYYTTTSNYDSRPAVVLPGIDPANYDISNVVLSFWAAATTSTYHPRFVVGVMGNPYDLESFTAVDTVQVEGTAMTQYTVSLSGYRDSGTFVAIRQIAPTFGTVFYAYMDDVSLRYEDCARPAVTLAAVTDSSATLRWTSMGALYYEVSDTANALYGTRLLDTTYRIDSLERNTEYTLYFRSHCTIGQGEWQPFTFRTDCGKLRALPWMETFEAAPSTGSGSEPYCWRFLSDGTGSYAGDYPNVGANTTYSQYSYRGANCLYAYMADSLSHVASGTPTYNIAVLPRVDTAACPTDSLRLSFYGRLLSTSSLANVIVGTMADPDSVSTFVPLDTIAVTHAVHDLYELPLTGLGMHTEWLALKMERDAASTSSYGYLYLDDVTLARIPDCPRVSDVAIAGINASGVSISWRETGEATDWHLSIDTTDVLPSWQTPLDADGDTNYTFGNLLPQTTYYVYIQPICNIGNAEAAMFSFTTPCAALDTLPYTMDFEGLATGGSTLATDIPCWTRLTDATVYVGYPYVSGSSSYRHGGTRGLYWMKGAGSSPDYGTEMAMVAPAVNTEHYDLNNVSVKFWAKATSTIYAPTFAVGVMTNPFDINTFVGCDTVSMQGTAWQELTASLASYEGEGAYIAIRASNTPVGGRSWNAALDDITLEYISCPKPVAYAETFGDSVSLHWAGTSASYEVRLAVTGTATNLLSITTTTGDQCGLGGLGVNTDYTFAVRSLCTGDTSAWDSLSFATPCGTIDALPYSYGFEGLGSTTMGYFPNCWQRLSDGTVYDYYPWAYNISSYAHTGSCGLYWFSSAIAPYAGDYNYAVLPQLNTDSLTASDLSFSFYAKLESNSAPHHFYVGVMTDPTDNDSFVPVDTIQVTSADWQMAEVDFAGYTGNGAYIALKMPRPDAAWYAATDDFTLYATPACARPSRFYEANLTTSSLTLGWTRGATTANYIVEYTDGSTVQTLTTTTNSVNISGLMANTIYQARVRALCSATDSSDWSEYHSFRTACGLISTLPYTEDFEAEATGSTSSSSFVTCWNRLSDAPSYRYPYVYSSATYSHSGSKSLYWYNTEYSPTYYGTYQCIVLPEVDTTVYPMDTLRLTFWSRVSSASYQPTLLVGVMTDPDSVETFTVVDTVHVSGMDYAQYQVDFNGYNGHGNYVAIKAEAISSYWYAYLDDVTLNHLPSCNPPRNLTAANVTATTADLSWTHQASSFILHYHRPADTVGVDTVVNGNGVTLSGLSALTQYDWTLRALCGADTSTASEQASFVTAMCADAVFDTIGSFVATDFCEFLPNREASPYSYSQQIIDSAELGLFYHIDALEFWSSSATTQDDDCQIYVGHTSKHSFASDTDWVPLSSLTLVWSGDMNMAAGWNAYGFDSTFVYDGHSSLVVAVYRADGATASGISAREASALSTTKTLYAYGTSAFTPGSIAGTTSLLRNIMRLSTCDGLPCQPPTLGTAAVTYNGATVQWHGNSATYEVAVRNARESAWPEHGTTVEDSSFAFTGLTPLTTYYYRVRGLCDTDDLSDWTVSSFVTDSLPCYAPASLAANAGFGDVELSWASDGSVLPNWNVRVWNATFSQAYSAAANSYTATGLTPGTQYYAAVQTVCDGGLANSAFSDTVSFTTDVCDVPGNLAASVQGTTATLTWSAGDNNTGLWTVEYGYADFASGDGTQVSANAASATLTDLEPQTAYDVYVRALCNGQYPSTWSARASFTTGGVGLSTAEAASVSLYPNPASQGTTVRVSGMNGSVTISVVDMEGRIVSNVQAECSASCVKTLNVSHLAAGTYFVHVQGDGLNAVRKLIVK